MATTSTQRHQWAYDVFVSFRGEDIRKSFMDHLFKDFEEKAIHAFRDDKDLALGECISLNLCKAIQESRFLIVIFSRNYASSSWCLGELVKILECNETSEHKHKGLIIYYDVKPGVVRKQTKSYAEAFAKHEISNTTEVAKWKEALYMASDLSGWDLQHMTNGYESKFTTSISKDIHKVLCHERLQVGKNLVGFDAPNLLSKSRKIGNLLVSDKEIGKGSNGTIVLEGRYYGRPVAVKRIVKVYHDVAWKEIENLMVSDQHPNIVRWYGVECDQDFVYIALERCVCSLHELVLSHTNSTVQLQMTTEVLSDFELWKPNGHPSPVLLKVMRDTVTGLAHLHELGFIHRDLKPRNVLILKDNSISAKVSDMGISKRLPADTSSLTKSATGYGTSGWQAPEQLRIERQTRAVDLFSFGCLLFFCITRGQHPFGDMLERDINIVNDRKDLSLVDNIPEAFDLISNLLHPDPEFRPKAAEVYNHPLFWDSEMRLSFLRDASDRVEFENRVTDSDLLKSLESIGTVALGGKWDEKLDNTLVNDLGRYRKYKYHSVRDLLRVIRNKLNHYRELPKELRDVLGPVPTGFEYYFSSRFPKLLLEVYKILQKYCGQEEFLHKYYKQGGPSMRTVGKVPVSAGTRAVQLELACKAMEKRKAVSADTIRKRAKLSSGRAPPLKTPIVKGEKASTKLVDAPPMDYTPTKGGSSRSGAATVATSSQSRGGRDKSPVVDSGVTEVNFMLPSDFLVEDMVDHRKLFPHPGKYAFPSQQRRFEGVSVEGVDASVTGLSFMAFQSALALHARVEELNRQASTAIDREKTTIKKEKAALEKARTSLAALDTLHVRIEDLKSDLETVERVRDEANDRLRCALEQVEEKEEELRRLLADMEEDVAFQSRLAEEVESSYALERMTAKAAIFRPYAQGRDPFVTAAAELKTYLSSLSTEEDLDRDDAIGPVVMEDEAAEEDAGATDAAFQAEDVAGEATEGAIDEEVVAGSKTVEEGVAEDPPPDKNLL